MFTHKSHATFILHSFGLNLFLNFIPGTATSEIREAIAEAYRAESKEARRQTGEEDEGAVRHDGVQEKCQPSQLR